MQMDDWKMIKKSKHWKDNFVGWHKYQTQNYHCPQYNQKRNLTLIGVLTEIEAKARDHLYACDNCNKQC